jgi:hypothetical protein
MTVLQTVALSHQNIANSTLSVPNSEPLALPLALDTDLASVIVAWPTLPEPIRRAVLALVTSAGGKE